MHRWLIDLLKEADARSVACVPNFSGGRDAATIDALRSAITAVTGVRLSTSRVIGA